jgi:hypothetical protein
MSRQAYRLERQLPAILEGAEQWLESLRAAQVVWEMAAKQAEFGHLVVAGYRQGRYSAIASLVRTLFEDATLLAWMAIPNDSEKQAPRVLQVMLRFYKEAVHKGLSLPPDAEELLKTTTGAAARNPPSWEDRVRQLDADEADKEDGKPFWATHVAHVEMLNDYVHSHPGGTGQFTDPMTRELLGFEALVFGHQYLTLSVVSVVRLSNQNALAARAQAAFARIHAQEMNEMRRLFK